MPLAGFLIIIPFLIEEEHQIRGILPIMLEQAPKHIDLVLRRGASIDIDAVRNHRRRIRSVFTPRKLAGQIYAVISICEVIEVCGINIVQLLEDCDIHIHPGSRFVLIPTETILHQLPAGKGCVIIQSNLIILFLRGVYVVSAYGQRQMHCWIKLLQRSSNSVRPQWSAFAICWVIFRPLWR